MFNVLCTIVVVSSVLLVPSGEVRALPQATPPPHSQPGAPSADEAPVIGWVRYQNALYGYSLSVPASSNVDETKADRVTIQIPTTAPDARSRDTKLTFGPVYPHVVSEGEEVILLVIAHDASRDATLEKWLDRENVLEDRNADPTDVVQPSRLRGPRVKATVGTYPATRVSREQTEANENHYYVLRRRHVYEFVLSDPESLADQHACELTRAIQRRVLASISLR